MCIRDRVKIVSEEEYEEWLGTQNSYYLSTIRNTDNDPFKGQLLDTELKARKSAFNDNVQKALASDVNKIIKLEYVNFETGSATLTALSRYELDNVVAAMGKYPTVTIEVAGHTDSTGSLEGNVALSDARANSVATYLTSKGVAGSRLRAVGYGPNKPVDTNDTDAGRANNRRTELEILTQ